VTIESPVGYDERDVQDDVPRRRHRRPGRIMEASNFTLSALTGT
jgi:hypothetical protein